MSKFVEQVNSWLTKPKKSYLNGEWVGGSAKSLSCLNPSSMQELCGVNSNSIEQLDQAVAAANKAYQLGEFQALAKREQARILREMGQVTRENIEELATIEALNNGKLFKEALNDDLPDCADIFDYYAGWTDKVHGHTYPVGGEALNYSYREPLGVCGLIVPWNFPLLMAMWKLAPALAAGNCVIIKPSEQTPLSLIRWFELITEKVNLPQGLLNLVLGDHEIGSALTSHPHIHKIGFTGSTAVGRKILEASANSNLKSISLELGGKSPNIFFADTPDLEAAIERSFHLIFSQKGEKCSEPTRFIIHESIYDQVAEGLVSRLANYPIGQTFDATAMQGAQNNVGHFKKINQAISLADSEGMQCLFGGSKSQQQFQDMKSGLFVTPTIYGNVPVESKLWQEEIFGPVLALAKFKTDNEAIQLANATEYGLAAGLWTSDITRAHTVAKKLDAGMIFINKYGQYDFSSPFGGFRQSGFGGKDMGLESMHAYTKLKSIWVKF